jgi:hypothetical protein
MLMTILGKIQSNSPQNQSSVVVNSQSPPQHQGKQHLTDTQIEQYLENVPNKYLKIGRKMGDEQLKLFITNQMPLLDDDTIQRVILNIKGR